ncbi:MAG TPA: phosphoribosylglycinamide synthetase C domain-containing protein, partial [Acidimicrobiales bacterium]
TGDPISGLDGAAAAPGVTVFHAGTRADADTGAVVTSGGRVLGVTGLGPTLEEARARAYAGVAAIDWPGEHHRTDIALRAAAGAAAGGRSPTPGPTAPPTPTPKAEAAR